ncbi:MAG: hypothetical protein ACRDFW_11550 [bacterium]
MSTPEERLRQKAKEVDARRTARERQEQEDEAHRSASQQDRARRASAEADVWLKRLEQMIAATQKRIPRKMDYDLGRDITGFHLQVGTAEVRLELDDNGWQITRARGCHPTIGNPTSPEMRDRILEQMVEGALEDLVEGRIEPSPER